MDVRDLRSGGMPAVSDLKLLWWEKKFCSRRTSFVSRIVNQRP